MSHIYKIYNNVNNSIVDIFIFMGSKITPETDYNNETLNKLFDEDPQNELFKEIFTREEYIYLKTNDVNLNFIDDNIYIDDSIETIKKKICLYTSLGNRISFDEIYLFYKQKRKLESTIVYQELTQNESIELTKDRLFQFLLNISYQEIESIPIKEIYTYNDIISLNLDISDVNFPLGQTFKSVKKTFPFTVNPFDVIEYDTFLERNAEDITSTTNHNLLLETTPIENNIIYLCLAKEVLQYTKQNNLSEESTIKIYFPFLLEKNILSLELLSEKKEELLLETNEITNEVFKKNIKDIKLFNDVKDQSTSELSYEKKGIKMIEFIIKPLYDFILPLDIVFKLIHATKNVPFIKYNPGRRKEKIYRLYAPTIAKNGKKIPFLRKGIIYKLVKTIGTEKCVAMYVEKKIDINKKHVCIIEFYESGKIYVKMLFNDVISEDNINELLKECILPTTNIIEEFLSQSGYTINTFEDIKSNNIIIMNMEYSFKIAIEQTINLESYYNCLSSVFNILQPDIHKVAILRYKRVANYNEMDGQEALIVTLLNNGNSRDEIIQSLMDNYKLSEETAREKIASFVDGLQVMETAYQDRKLKIKNNPGFLTSITFEKFSNNIIIDINNINNIEYLNTIPTYIDSLIRMTQDMKSTKVLEETINELCRTPEFKLSDKYLDGDEDETKVVDIVAPVDNPENIAVPLTIIADELHFENLSKEEGEEEEGDNMLDIIMDSDEDSDDDDDDDSDSDGEGWSEIVIGGAKETHKKDLTGLSLNNPNPFAKRMDERDPALFVYDDGGKFKAYSRTCAWNLRRQPVILTQSEKDKIDKDHPGSYDKAIEYGSSEDKKHWYICPRYWSLKDNVSLTQEQVESGKYGNLIKPNAKIVPKDGNIIEFNSKIHKDKDGKYKNLNPGFLKPDIHPNKKCMPCCFKSWTSKEQVRRREECSMNVIDKPPTLERQDSDIIDDYIKAPNKFPLAQTRLGYLPLPIQRFLHIDNKKCQISASNANIKLNYKCLLRYGVESNIKQSFLGCIGTILPDQTKTPTDILTIKETKSKLVKALHLDLFITLQNGSLVESFSKAFPSDIDIDKYSDTKIYSITDKDNEKKLATLKKMINAYEGFIKFINDDTIQIDYTYLWDLICTSNPYLFKAGVNLVILEIKDDDITNNVHLVCPSNHYSSIFFDINKPSIILIKKDDFYEPIIQYKETSSTYEIKKRFFMKKISDISPEVINILQFIKQTLHTKCSPLPSMPKVYKFKPNLPLGNIVSLLNKKKYTILSQIMNYNGKIISLHIQKNDMKGILPCEPSSLILDLPGDVIWMDDEYGHTYEETIKFLEYVYKDFNGEIPCNPSVKVIEDDLIVGVLTITNQFVILSEPTQDLYGEDYPSISGENYNAIDAISISDKSIDEERYMNIKKIKLETAYYRNFRNTIRIFLGKFDNRVVRQNVEKIIDSPTILYLNKLELLVNLLKESSNTLFKFSTFSDKVIKKLTDITNCYNNNSCEEKSYCFVRDDRTCSLVIPKNNLINDIDNEEVYYGRLADELIRYQRIKTFILQPKVFLTFENIKYNLNDDEIILLQSLLMNKYFDDLDPMIKNEYVHYNSYDNAEPIITQPYNNTIEYNNKEIYEDKKDSPKMKIIKIKKKKKVKNIKLDVEDPEGKEPEDKEPEGKDPDREDLPSLKKSPKIEVESKESKESNCPNKEPKLIPTRWRKVFPAKIKSIEYKDGKDICTYRMISRIILDNNQLEIDKTEIQKILLQEYTKYMSTYNMENIWKAQGKSKIFTKLKKGDSLDSIILNPDYNITNIDLWILAFKYSIPIILISSTKLQENVKEMSDEEKYILVMNSDFSGKYYIIKPSATSQMNQQEAVRSAGGASYRLLILDNNIKIPINSMNSRWSEFVEDFQNQNDLKRFLEKGEILQKRRKLIIKEKK